MILGTAQLGIKYGINNIYGKPSKQDVFDILEYAYGNGIDILDTANAYGDSEINIGQYIEMTGHTFKICTKSSVDNKGEGIEDWVGKSIANLKCESIFIYYLHRFEQCKNKEILRKLIELKKRGILKYIGISIYEPFELEYIIKNIADCIDVVQIPFNVFDNFRWIKGGCLTQAKEIGIKIFARSIYLQGLIFTGPDTALANEKQIAGPLNVLTEICRQYNCNIGELAVSFIKGFDFIDDYLVGCETLQQIQQNIKTDKIDIHLNESTIQELYKLSSSIHENVIDPRKWGD